LGPLRNRRDIYALAYWALFPLRRNAKCFKHCTPKFSFQKKLKGAKSREVICLSFLLERESSRVRFGSDFKSLFYVHQPRFCNHSYLTFQRETPVFKYLKHSLNALYNSGRARRSAFIAFFTREKVVRRSDISGRLEWSYSEGEKEKKGEEERNDSAGAAAAAVGIPPVTLRPVMQRRRRRYSIRRTTGVARRGPKQMLTF
jgi:hypothetical protein